MEGVANRAQWTNDLDTNAHGRKVLTLPKACEIAAAGDGIGWYVAPFAMKWTVGRVGPDDEHYHVINGDEPITFDETAAARSFLRRVLHVSAPLDLGREFPRNVPQPGGVELGSV